MNNEDKKKIAQILKDNEKWPIIVEGICAKTFKDAVVIPASIPSDELGTKIDDKGNIIFPDWLNQIKKKENLDQPIIVCIEGIEKVDPDDQQKFYGMLKYNGINGCRFSRATRIVIATSDASKISKGISDLALLVKVE